MDLKQFITKNRPKFKPVGSFGRAWKAYASKLEKKLMEVYDGKNFKDKRYDHLDPHQSRFSRSTLIEFKLLLEDLRPRHPSHPQSTFFTKKEYDQAYKAWKKKMDKIKELIKAAP